MTALTFSVLSIAAAVGIYYGVFWLDRPTGLIRSVLKTTPVTLLVVAAWAASAPLWLIVALIFSAAGDAFLSREGESMFLAGLVSFLSAHLAFIVLFVGTASTVLEVSVVSIAICLLTVTLMALVLRNLWHHLAAMKIPVIVYALAIGTMNISAWVFGQNLVLLVGVALFVFSDCVLAHQLFKWKDPVTCKRASLAVWFSYLPAQFLILIAMIEPVAGT